MQTKKVKPYGMLFSNGREYFALSPHPVESEDWEWDSEVRTAFRWAVVPRKDLNANKLHDMREKYTPLYSYARHIVTNSFVMEYADMPEINIKVLEIGDE